MAEEGTRQEPYDGTGTERDHRGGQDCGTKPQIPQGPDVMRGGRVVTGPATGSQMEQYNKELDAYNACMEANDAERDKGLTELENRDKIEEEAKALIDASLAEETPQAEYTNVGTAAQVGGVTIDPVTYANAAELGEVSQAGTTQVGDAYATGAAQVAPSTATQIAQVGATTATGYSTIEQQQQAEFRQRQVELSNYLTAQATGEGEYISDLRWKEATDRNIAQQQALAASSRGGDAAMARRGAAQNVSAFNQAAANKAAEGRLMEQGAAREQLASLVTAGRNTDVGLATAQSQLEQQGINATAASENAGKFLQAQLTQTGMSQTAAAENATKLLQAQLEQQGLTATAAAENAVILVQAQLEQQVALFNANAKNTFTIKQGEFEQQVNLTNAQAENVRSLQQATLDQQVQFFNADAVNSFMQLQAELDQGTSLANMAAKLQKMGLDNDLTMAYLSLMAKLDVVELDARLKLEGYHIQEDIAENS